MERADLDAVRVATDQLNQALAHGLGARFGIGEAEDVAWGRIALGQDVCRAQAQQLRLAGAGTGNNEQWSIQAFDGFALLGVQSLKRCDEFGGHVHGDITCLLGRALACHRDM